MSHPQWKKDLRKARKQVKRASQSNLIKLDTHSTASFQQWIKANDVKPLKKEK